jgi:predicted nucleic acid-binding protein
VFVNFLNQVYNVDREIALVAIGLRRKRRIKTPDALIAATAIFYDLVLVSRDISDFSHIKGLKIVNPYTI